VFGRRAANARRRSRCGSTSASKRACRSVNEAAIGFTGNESGTYCRQSAPRGKVFPSAEIRRFGGTGLLPAGPWARDFVGGTAHQLELALGRGFPIRWDWNETPERRAFRVRAFERQPALIESAPEPRTCRRHRT